MIIKDLTLNVTTATPELSEPELNHVWKATTIDEEGERWTIIATAWNYRDLLSLVETKLRRKVYNHTCLGVTACKRQSILVLSADREMYALVLGERVRLELRIN